MRDRFAGWKVAVVAGDRRQLEIVRQFLQDGALVSTYGVPASGDPSIESLRRPDLRAAILGARLVSLPIPTFLRDNILYAPLAGEEITLDEGFLSAVSPGAFLSMGKVPEPVKAAADKRGFTVFTISDDDVMQVHHAIPTAEGAVAITVKETDYTIHSSNALVIGHGRVGQAMARALKGLGAHVWVAARRPEVRARAFADGYVPIGMEELLEQMPEMDLVYSTATALTVTRQVLERVKPGALIIDLVSPPGGVDHGAAKELGVNVVWARGQAGTAPREAGRAQYGAIAAWFDRHRR